MTREEKLAKGREYAKKYRAANLEKVRKSNRDSHFRNHERNKVALTMAYHKTPLPERRAAKKKWYAEHREEVLAKHKLERLKPGYQAQKKRNHIMQLRKLRRQLIEAYGGKCACCEEERAEFLTIDHIEGNGSHHRREVGVSMYRFLRRQGFPKDKYRLLCMNCNFAYGMFGYCPHQYELAVCA